MPALSGAHNHSTLNGVRRLRIALAQINVTVGALSANVKRIVRAAREAHDAGAQIVVFPELAIPGYPPEDLLLRPGFVSDNLRALDDVCRATANLHGMTLMVGFADRGADLYNAAAILRDGVCVDIYHKSFLPNYSVFDEDRYFQPGESAPCYLIDGVMVGVSICEDIWYPGGPPTIQAYKGAEVLLNLSSSPFFVGKQVGRERMLATRASDTGSIVAYCNLVGGQDELIFDGNSVVFDGQGELIARAKAFEEDMLLVDLDIEDVFRTRLHDPRRRKEKLDHRGDIPAPIVIGGEVTHAHTAPPPLAPRIEPSLSRVEEAYRALVLGVRDYVGKNGFSSAVIALSGGVDSALTAVIAVDALGADAVTGVSMPSRYSSAGSRDDARALADNLGIRYLTLPIEPVFGAMLDVLREPFEVFPSSSTLAEENVQARIRGNLLMAISNRSGAIVLTTGNKSEMAVGYATLYGDMAGGFAVLKDVFKTFLYELSRWRNEQAGRDLMPESTLTKPPSAELRPGQQDTDSLPPYDVLDPILQAYVEDDRSPAAIVDMGFDLATVQRVITMVERAEYKRRQAPPGVKITERAFGRDRRLPITNGYLTGAADVAKPPVADVRERASARVRASANGGRRARRSSS
ncbi:MAG TPA: NAD+ synthase [Ktedonobacterales bacterium]|nr:NAD+ synthase [Ktedonobacterales bacterium]